MTKCEQHIHVGECQRDGGHNLLWFLVDFCISNSLILMRDSVNHKLLINPVFSTTFFLCEDGNNGLVAVFLPSHGSLLIYLSF